MTNYDKLLPYAEVNVVRAEILSSVGCVWYLLTMKRDKAAAEPCSQPYRDAGCIQASNKSILGQQIVLKSEGPVRNGSEANANLHTKLETPTLRTETRVSA